MASFSLILLDVSIRPFPPLAISPNTPPIKAPAPPAPLARVAPCKAP